MGESFVGAKVFSNGVNHARPGAGPSIKSEV